MLPLLISEEEIEELQESTEDIVSEQASKTYYFDFDTGEIYSKFINYEEAIRQAVIKAIKTTRDRYLIYSSDYGCEITYLMGKGYSSEYLEIEVPRLIEECLMVDERIESVDEFTITKQQDTLNISFVVNTTTQSTIQVEVTI